MTGCRLNKSQEFSLNSRHIYKQNKSRTKQTQNQPRKMDNSLSQKTHPHAYFSITWKHWKRKENLNIHLAVLRLDLRLCLLKTQHFHWYLNIVTHLLPSLFIRFLSMTLLSLERWLECHCHIGTLGKPMLSGERRQHPGQCPVHGATSSQRFLSLLRTGV